MTLNNWTSIENIFFESSLLSALGSDSFYNIFHPHLWIELVKHLDADSYSCLYFTNKQIQIELRKFLDVNLVCEKFCLNFNISENPCHFYQWYLSREFVFSDKIYCWLNDNIFYVYNDYIDKGSMWENIKAKYVIKQWTHETKWEFKKFLDYVWFWENRDLEDFILAWELFYTKNLRSDKVKTMDNIVKCFINEKK